MNHRRYTVIGVPSSAGAHYAGQDLAPGVMRHAGLLDRLASRAIDVQDDGDVAGETFRVDHENPRHRNLAAVVRVARSVADAVERIRRSGRVALVLGGDCTITLGVLTGVQRVDPDVGIAYFDGDGDLTTPSSTQSGILDSMGVSHLLGLADTELARLDHASPMIQDDHLLMLGYDETDADSYNEAALALHPGVTHIPWPELAEHPEAVTRTAVNGLSRRASPIIVHFDVDAVDSRDLPLANFPHYGTGLSLEEAAVVLRALCSTPQLAAVVLTEVNPGHDPSGVQLDRYIDVVADALR